MDEIRTRKENSPIKKRLQASVKVNVNRCGAHSFFGYVTMDKAFPTSNIRMTHFPFPSSSSEYEQAAKSLADKGAEVRLAMVNAMEEMELAKRFEIRGFPTLKYFKHGVIPRDYQGPRKADVSHVFLIFIPFIRCHSFHRNTYTQYYRASHVVIDLGWVDWILSFPCLLNSSLADGNLADVAGQLGQMVELSNQSQPNPGLRPIRTPCTFVKHISLFIHVHFKIIFQVATNASGRGVLRLILQQKRLNLLEILVLCIQLLLLAFPTWEAPLMFCMLYETLARFVLAGRWMSSLAIALGR